MADYGAVVVVAGLPMVEVYGGYEPAPVVVGFVPQCEARRGAKGKGMRCGRAIHDDREHRRYDGGVTYRWRS